MIAWVRKRWPTILELIMLIVGLQIMDQYHMPFTARVAVVFFIGGGILIGGMSSGD